VSVTSVVDMNIIVLTDCCTLLDSIPSATAFNAALLHSTANAGTPSHRRGAISCSAWCVIGNQSVKWVNNIIRRLWGGLSLEFARPRNFVATFFELGEFNPNCPVLIFDILSESF
jgi:hypothetical protein